MFRNLTQIRVKLFEKICVMQDFPQSFAGCDKDKSEIDAINDVWPLTNAHLCFWHTRHAIRSTLKDFTKSNTQRCQFLDHAEKLVQSFEICWGSHSTNRLGREHKFIASNVPIEILKLNSANESLRFGICDYEIRNSVFESNDGLETSSVVDGEMILSMFSRHFNSHTSIRDCNDTFQSLQAIWYGTGQWELWARWYNPVEMPMLETTMIVEPHQRKIKHDHLHRFNRTCIDLVIQILKFKCIPHG